MSIRPPSQKWVSQRLAVLESLSSRIDRRLNLLCIPYFFALGYLLQGWWKANFGAVEMFSSVDAIGLLVSLAVMAVLGPVLLTLVSVLKIIRARI